MTDSVLSKGSGCTINRADTVHFRRWADIGAMCHASTVEGVVHMKTLGSFLAVAAASACIIGWGVTVCVW